jgi:transcriptional regulator with XRE-family HTH domain
LTTLADELRARMRAAGLKPKTLATLAGVNQTYVRDILRGRSKNPKVEQLAKVTSVLGTSITEVMPRTAPETVRQKIGRRMRLVREYRRQSLEEFASTLDVPASDLAIYEAGGAAVPGDLLLALAQQTGVSTDFIIIGSMNSLDPAMAAWMKSRLPDEMPAEPPGSSLDYRSG